MVATDAERVLADESWMLLKRRERGADARFFYAVRTTGIFCRPWCPSRLPRPENVAFYRWAQDALRAGYRPCRRCSPLGSEPLNQRAVAWCRWIERCETRPNLSQLAASAGLSESQLRRQFKAATGLTPAQYFAAGRAEQLQRELRRGPSVTAAIVAAGYGSSSRFYEQSDATLGMPARDYREGGVKQLVHYAIRGCELGRVLVAATDKGVCAILLGDDERALVADLRRRLPKANMSLADAQFEDTVAAVVRLVDRPAESSDLPLDLQGTSFQRRVWNALRRVPPGRPVSYSELARRIGQPQATRAVAGACAANPAAVVVPCHRVVRKDGSLSGYRWGLERKRRLLELERQQEDRQS